MNYNLFERPDDDPAGVRLPAVHDQGIPASAYLDRAWAGALTLILIVMVLNLVARLVAPSFAPKTGR